VKALYAVLILFICQAAAHCDLPPSVRARFAEAADSGRMRELISRRRTFNIDHPTLGGKVFWTTYQSGNWKLQVNDISGFWRILDKDDVRRARGCSLGELEAVLSDLPSSWFANYLDDGFVFSEIPAKGAEKRKVILIHGCSVRASSMVSLGRALAEKGCRVYIYDYPSAKLDIPGHSRMLLARLRELFRREPGCKFSFVTHSMGGLLLRRAMADMSAEECALLDALVMLGPPNLGSAWAYAGDNPVVRLVHASLGDMTPERDSVTLNIRRAARYPDIAVIAGRYDGKVSVANTHLPDGIRYTHTVVPATHPGLRDPENVLDLILQFFEKRKFEEK
jgi:pimeloyl-ACP methyl ester carboxylesterase